MRDKKKRDSSNVILIFISCALVGAGFLLTLVQGIAHGPEYISAYFTKVEHPIKPNFDNYDKFLQDVVRGDRVDYARCHNNRYMAQALKDLAALSCDEFGSDSDRLAYWINAYNLLVIKTISDHFPIATLTLLTNELNSHRYTVGGQAITVKDISQLKIQQLLSGSKKGDYTDARMIFLIAGGAMGYPSVNEHAVTTDLMLKDMEAGLYAYIHKTRNVYYDKIAHTLYISPFFQWNEAVLRQSYPDAFEFVSSFLAPAEKPNPTDYHATTKFSTKFDWRINDITTKD